MASAVGGYTVCWKLRCGSCEFESHRVQFFFVFLLLLLLGRGPQGLETPSKRVGLDSSHFHLVSPLLLVFHFQFAKVINDLKVLQQSSVVVIKR